MIYTNINGVKIGVSDLPIYTKCPVCRTEFQFPEFWEILIEDSEIDLLDDDCSFYCDTCRIEYQRIKDTMKTLHPEADEQTVHTMSDKMQRKLHSGITA